MGCVNISLCHQPIAATVNWPCSWQTWRLPISKFSLMLICEQKQHVEGNQSFLLITGKEGRQNYLNAIQQSVVWFLPPGGQIRDAWCIWGSTSGRLWHRGICFVNHEPAILLYKTLVNCTGIEYTTQSHICEIVLGTLSQSM